MNAVLDEIGSLGVVPVVVIDDPADAPALMAALADGGLPVAEFTFRTSAAADAIRAASAARPDALVLAIRIRMSISLWRMAWCSTRAVPKVLRSRAQASASS